MSLFPLTLPPDPAPRRDIAVNLARLVGPMFGVISDRSPHGMTWICDFDAVTLKELGRGAPIPATADIDDPEALTSGTWVGRAIYSARGAMLDGEIAAATLNRYGPDTKSAVVLTAANVLYRDLVADTEAALRVLIKANPQVAPVVHLATWAAAALVGFRAAPLLCSSALKARTYQRAAFTQWQVTSPGNREAPARCELGQPTILNVSGHKSSKYAPRRFELIDSTIELLRDFGIVTTTDGLDLLASMWSRRLLRLGVVHEGEPALFWASEVEPGHRTIESYLPPLSLLTLFVNEQRVIPGLEKLVTASASDSSQRLDLDQFTLRIPDADEVLGELTPQGQRMLVELAGIALRWVRGKKNEITTHSSTQERIDFTQAIHLALGRNRALAEGLLDNEDLVSRYAVVSDELAGLDTATDRGEAVDLSTLIENLDSIRALIHSRRISDLGTGMDAIERGAVLVRRYADAVAPEGGESEFNRDVLLEKVRSYRETNYLVLNDETGLPRGASPAGYYLHNYAGYLSTHTDNEVDLRTALDLLRERVIPSRRSYGIEGRMSQLRLSLQIAARCSAQLAALELERGHEDFAQQLISESAGLAREVLDMSHVQSILGSQNPTAEGFRLAVAILPGLLLAAESEPRENRSDSPGDEDLARVLELGERWLAASKKPSERDRALFRDYRDRFDRLQK